MNSVILPSVDKKDALYEMKTQCVFHLLNSVSHILYVKTAGYGCYQIKGENLFRLSSEVQSIIKNAVNYCVNCSS